MAEAENAALMKTASLLSAGGLAKKGSAPMAKFQKGLLGGEGGKKNLWGMLKQEAVKIAVNADVEKRCGRPKPLKEAGMFKARKTHTVKPGMDLRGSHGLQGCRTGDILELEAGVYNISCLTITVNDLIVKPAKFAEVTLVADKSSVLELNADYCRIEGIKIVSKGDFPAVVVNKGSPELINCDISGFGGGVVVKRGDPTLMDCCIHDCKRASGVHFIGTCGRVEGCEISNNGDAAILLEKSAANPWVSKCKIIKGKGCGIAALEYSRGVFLDCEISQNACAGVYIKESAHPLFFRCKMEKNKAPAVNSEAGGRGQFESCEFEKNVDNEIEISKSANPTIRRCSFKNGKASAILVSNNGLGVIEFNSFLNYQVAAVSVAHGADPLIGENTIEFGEDCNVSYTAAVLVRDGGRGKVNNNNLLGWSVEQNGKDETKGKMPIIVRNATPQILHNVIK
mmetsp:Transcript_144779/g.252409  ORF Transcript_144779/g.252409 Transcript_144779/m.252409 type:complete len:454 (-) Transcript_144779:623-1984(-)